MIWKWKMVVWITAKKAHRWENLKVKVGGLIYC